MAFPNIYDQIGMRDLGSFTIPADPYFPELGLEVPITPEAINSLYWIEPIQSHSIFYKKVEDKGNHFQWVANMISLSQPQWAISRGLIHHRDLNMHHGSCAHQCGGAHCRSIQMKSQAAGHVIAITQPR
ncbi:hypothetical protein HAX54_019193, partial [Datura stramonium]|nr:hypothetical protein [Datura stramonium]